MYTYHHRIYDRYHRPVESLAVLCDRDPNWRPITFTSRAIECQVEFQFPIVKLLDYKQQWTTLETSCNLFSTVIMAHLKAQETYKDKQQRKAWKLLLTKRLYEQGYEREDVLKLFKFIDWVIQLPEELTKTFWQELNQYEQEHSMPYITSIERLGITKGLEQGRQEGRQEEASRLLVRLLQRRFETVTPDIQEQLQSLNVDQLEDLLDLALSVPTIDQLIEQLPNPAP